MIKVQQLNWKLVPILVGGLSLCAVFMGLLLNQRLADEYSSAASVNHKWSQFLEHLDELQLQANAVNAPGNDIFESKNESYERERFVQALRKFHTQLDALRNNADHESIDVDKVLSSSLENVHKNMNAMVEDENLIFNNFGKLHDKKAINSVASMNRQYALLRNAILDVRKIIRGIQSGNLESQKIKSDRLREQEIYFIFFLVSVTMIMFFYGSRILKFMSKSRHHLEQKRIALDASTSVVISDVQGKITYVNEHFLKLSKYSKNELSGKKYRDFCSDGSDEEKFNDLWQTVCAKKIWTGEFKSLSKSGELYWVTTTVVPIVDQQGHLESLVDIRFDITERKKSEEALLEAKTQAELAHSTKARFLANMSHEIRTPMNGIIGMTSLLMGTTEDPLYIERLKIIQNCGNSLLDLINDVLDFSKLEVDKVELENEPFALHEIAKEVVELLGTRASEKGILLSYVPGSEVPRWINGDETRFRQILTNLVSNGLKFTEKGGVKISSSAKKLEDGQWSIEFAVKDSGIGIAADLRERLFQSFSQVDASTTRKFGGTGLGLVISKGLCEKMGGTIRVESQLGKGSTFFFSLKAEESQPPLSSKSNNPFLEYDSNMAKSHPLRILVAEDNRTNQLVILGLLGKFGYQADIAVNGLEVLSHLEKKSYDLIFMDSHMPEMDGFAATREILKRYDSSLRPRIISLSASTLRQDIDRCFESGMDGFVGKPITIAALIKTLIHCRPLGANNRVIKKERNHMELEKKSVFDAKAFLVHFAGLEDLALEAIKSFLQSLPQLIQEIESAIQQKDCRAIELSAHTLKGSVSNFCAEMSRDLAYEIEKMGNLKKYDEKQLAEIFNQLKVELSLLKSELEKFTLQKKSA